jgi:hypothetical protein
VLDHTCTFVYRIVLHRRLGIFVVHRGGGMETSQDKEVSEAARLLGKRGGSKGGKAWAAALMPEERQLIARKAVTASWARQKAKTEDAQGHD